MQEQASASTHEESPRAGGPIDHPVLAALALLISALLWPMAPGTLEAFQAPMEIDKVAFLAPPLIGLLPLTLRLLFAGRWGHALYIAALLPLAELANLAIMLMPLVILQIGNHSGPITCASILAGIVWLTLGHWRYLKVTQPATPDLTKRIRIAGSFVSILLIMLLAGFLFSLMTSFWTGTPYTVRSRVSEMILAASPAKTALSEGMQTYGSWSPGWMSAITITATGVVASASIGLTGQIIVHGTAPTSGAVITMTPTITTDNRLVWSCTGRPKKYMPASCR